MESEGNERNEGEKEASGGRIASISSGDGDEYKEGDILYFKQFKSLPRWMRDMEKYCHQNQHGTVKKISPEDQKRGEVPLAVPDEIYTANVKARFLSRQANVRYVSTGNTSDNDDDSETEHIQEGVTASSSRTDPTAHDPTTADHEEENGTESAQAGTPYPNTNSFVPTSDLNLVSYDAEDEKESEQLYEELDDTTKEIERIMRRAMQPQSQRVAPTGAPTSGSMTIPCLLNIAQELVELKAVRPGTIMADLGSEIGKPGIALSLVVKGLISLNFEIEEQRVGFMINGLLDLHNLMDEDASCLPIGMVVTNLMDIKSLHPVDVVWLFDVAYLPAEKRHIGTILRASKVKFIVTCIAPNELEELGYPFQPAMRHVEEDGEEEGGIMRSVEIAWKGIMYGKGGSRKIWLKIVVVATPHANSVVYPVYRPAFPNQLLPMKVVVYPLPIKPHPPKALPPVVALPPVAALPPLPIVHHLPTSSILMVYARVAWRKGTHSHQPLSKLSIPS